MASLVALSSVLACAMADASIPLGYAAGVAPIQPYATPYAVSKAAHTYGGAILPAHVSTGYNLALPATRVITKAAIAPVVAAHAPVIAKAAIAPVVAAPAPVIAKAAIAPVVAAPAPVIAKAAIAPVVTKTAVVAPAPAVTTSQYRAGDEFGNTAFGYTNPISSRMEQGNADGVVTGSYSYVDEAGTHTRSYIADAYGFRLTGESGVAAPAAAHLLHKRSLAAFPYAYAAPQAYAGQAVRDAELHTVKLNPGHATFYRVY